MFGLLTEKLSNLFSSLEKKKLTEENLTDAVREVRLALLEADVHYTVAKQFVQKVKERAVGEQLLKSVTAGQQFARLVHDEIVALLGGGEATLHLGGMPTAIMLCGLQGMGKTTQAAKLAYFLKGKKYGKKPLLVACDLQRPAAVLQLKTLGAQIGVAVFALEGEKDPVKVARLALAHAREQRLDVVLFDTAGRLHIDEALMGELVAMKKAVEPHEVLFVASAATGQDAVKTAAEFDQKVGITGTILTMMDGDARGGAALSILQITGKPLKFEGVGEKMADLQLFHPRSLADRILGMGDAINLVKRAQEHFDEKENEQFEDKIRKASFTYEDYLKQMQAFKKMGSFQKLMRMIPGMSKVPQLDQSEGEFKKMEAIILAMTPRERQERDELTLSRVKRIAKGCGADVSEVHRLKKSFKQSKQLLKQMPKRKDLMEKMKNGDKLWQ